MSDDKRFGFVIPGGPRSSDNWERPPLPLQNFTSLGPLTPEQEVWWRDFGRAKDEFKYGKRGPK